MKNKEKYNLNELDITVSYQTDGCGHKVEKPFFVTVSYQGVNVVYLESVRKPLFRWLLEWLENENPPL